jgi:hypothetical protein
LPGTPAAHQADVSRFENLSQNIGRTDSLSAHEPVGCPWEIISTLSQGQ